MMSQQTTHKKSSLFKEKVVVCKETIAEVQTDALINFCRPNILSGPNTFKEIHQMAGPELAETCSYLKISPTTGRITSAFNASNFNFIVHLLVPSPLDLSRVLDLRKVYLCIRNSLNLAVEHGASTITFPSYFPGVTVHVICGFVLRVFAIWIHKNAYAARVSEIKIVCRDDKDFNEYVRAARNLYADIEFTQKYLQEERMDYLTPKAAGERAYARAKRFRKSRVTSPPRNVLPLRLELSAKLAHTILVVDDENGFKRQYRMTNKSRDGRKQYFRCSRCDTLIKKDGNMIRAKLIVEDGQIVSDPYPQHHPACQPKPPEDVVVQQIDRSSRRDIKEGNLMPLDAYDKAKSTLEHEVKNLEGQGYAPEILAERFPDWHQVRQQYLRLRKTALNKKREQQWQEFMESNGKVFNESGDGENEYDEFVCGDGQPGLVVAYDLQAGRGPSGYGSAPAMDEYGLQYAMFQAPAPKRKYSPTYQISDGDNSESMRRECEGNELDAYVVFDKRRRVKIKVEPSPLNRDQEGDTIINVEDDTYFNAQNSPMEHLLSNLNR